uniref:YARHG domain-containing protein n=1 Tax=Aliivibrio wodanis TaxID=80852 RepID=A0A5Q4Z000_9GAMM|nr:hypothetical protein AW0309160_03216 [Aliivibrio wodanis]
MKYILSIILLFMSVMSHAKSLRSIYEVELGNKKTGIYKLEDYTFFVVKQPCLTVKKYSNHKEEKEAKKKYFRSMKEYLSINGIEYNKYNWPENKYIRNDFSKIVSDRYPSGNVLQVREVINRNIEGCIREFVKAVSNEQFVSGVKLSDASVKKIELDILDGYITDVNVNGVNEFFKEKNINIISKGSFLLDDKYHVFDFESVFLDDLSDGLDKKDLSFSLYKGTEVDFNDGKNIDGIIESNILAINFNNENILAWYRLNALFRALNNKELATYISFRVFKIFPFDLDNWVYYMKSIDENSVEFHTFKEILIHIKNEHKMSDWAREQLKEVI